MEYCGNYAGDALNNIFDTVVSRAQRAEIDAGVLRVGMDEGRTRIMIRAISHQRTNDPRRLLTTNETARYLSVSPRTVWAITARGELPRIKLGRTVRYDVEDIEVYLKRSKIGGNGA
jgi:excisionase family DNA binding protein